jgi:hypothetical protein
MNNYEEIRDYCLDKASNIVLSVEAEVRNQPLNIDNVARDNQLLGQSKAYLAIVEYCNNKIREGLTINK